jgi:alkylhydroperoxidase/carboxymuconolactone decarboxylase family protein YurZ
VIPQLTVGDEIEGVATAGQRLANSEPITGGFMSSESPVLDTLADMTAASVDHNSLSPREYMLARVATLIAVDAPPISWFANAAAIQESGLTIDDIQGIMIAVAPVVGAPRVMAAGGHVLRALGIAIAVADAEIAEAELAAAEDSQP